jgi:hypothetical protein
MLSCVIYAYVRKTTYYARTMAVRWKRYCVYAGVFVFGYVYVDFLVSTFGDMQSANEMLSFSMQQFESTASTALGVMPMQPSPTRSCKISLFRRASYERVESFQAHPGYRNITELSRVTGDYESPLAICKMDMGTESGWIRWDLPHMMQHLYACYSYWLDHPSKIPVLYPLGISKVALERRHHQNAFLKGFTEILESRLGVRILYGVEIEDWLLERNHTIPMAPAEDGDDDDESEHEHEYDDSGDDHHNNKVASANPKIVEISRPLGYVFSHAGDLNEMAQRHYEMGNDRIGATLHHRDANPTSGNLHHHVKIGILNRKESDGRSIMNAELLAELIRNKVFLNSTQQAPLDASLPHVSPLVSLEYFDRSCSLEERIRYFNSIDILISPHGSQLTGIPFLANKACSHLIEIFPVGHSTTPEFFGSLAIDSGVSYTYVYVDSEEGNVDSTSKTKTTSQNMCVDVAVVVAAVQKAVEKWGRCQHQQKRHDHVLTIERK